MQDLLDQLVNQDLLDREETLETPVSLVLMELQDLMETLVLLEL